MSSESDFAWRMARFYGPQICLVARPQRLEFLRDQMLKLLIDMKRDSEAHKANCTECGNGDFCLQVLTYDARIDKLRFMRAIEHAEQRDLDYAERARTQPVIYDHHIDGFCAYWQNIRHRLFVSALNCCQRCKRAGPLEAHHRHYDSLGFEEISDLQALCRKCHESADRERAYNAGLATYAEKKYGEYWDEDQPIECLEEEFDRWIEDRGNEHG